MLEIIQQFYYIIWHTVCELFNAFSIPILMVIAVSVPIFVIKNKKYKAGAYYQMTRVPFLLVRFDLGRYGEYLTYKRLKSFEKEGAKFLFNTYIPKANGETAEIDVIMLTRKGIFVFESKNYSGWIFGSETQRNWYQTLPSGKGKSRKEHFYNPIMQNSSHIKHLKALIGEQYPIHSIIVFSERCTLKSVTVNRNDICVIKRDHVFQTASNVCKRTQADALTYANIVDLYKKLYPYTQMSEKEREQHISDIQNNLSKKNTSLSKSINTDNETDTAQKSVENESHENQYVNTESIDLNMDVPLTDKCPRCGGDLVLKTAKKGANAGNRFWGCANFPKCRYIKMLDEVNNKS